MTASKKVKLSELENFIQEELKKKLKTDFRELRIVREADVECCTYYHLRRFLKSDTRWKVFARRYSKKTKKYIDLLIFLRTEPKIAIEIKWRRKRITEKDFESLREALEKLGVNKCYYLVTPKDSEQYKYIDRSKDLKKFEKRLFHEVVVGLDLPPDEYKSWKDKLWDFTRGI